MATVMRKRASMIKEMSAVGASLIFCCHSLIGAEFTLFAPDQEVSSVKALSKVLRDGEIHKIEVVSSFEVALDRKSDVLVLLMERDAERQLDPESLAKLRERKVIGIGYGAARLFGSVGLEINGGACAHKADYTPEIRIATNLGAPLFKGQKMTAFRSEPASEWYVLQEIRKFLGIRKPGIPTRDNFAMYLPPGDDATQFVTALSRLTRDENYAPVVKQGNYIMSGFAASPIDWTTEYKEWFAGIAGALAAEAKVPFSKARWQTTPPGEYGFKLAAGKSTTALSLRKFYFRSQKPIRLSATLEHSGSRNVMLMFMGENTSLWTRKDAGSGETLRIDEEITEEDIIALADGYWMVRVVNFDRSAEATCKLVLAY